MKLICLILLNFIFVSCATQKFDAQNKVVFFINGKKIERFLDFKDGIAFIFSRDIYNKINVKAPINLFSFGELHNISGKIISYPKDTILLSSFITSKDLMFNKKISNFVIGFAQKEVWNEDEFNHLGTRFKLITKKSSEINSDHWKKSVKKIWSNLNKKFGSSTNKVTFVELDWAPISGGPLGENVLGIFSQKNIPEKFKRDLWKDLGWEEKKSTKEYVQEYYADSKKPWEDYLVGTYAHELTHLYFGFGKSRQVVNNAYELWFSLGLGMLYDINITQKMTGKKPAIFNDSFKVWKKYSSNKNIDQRLVNPIVLNDSKYNLDRKKVYAHSKAESFLRALRTKIGVTEFDNAVINYLNCKNCLDGYESFKKYLGPFHKTVTAVEKEYQVY